MNESVTTERLVKRFYQAIGRSGKLLGSSAAIERARALFRERLIEVPPPARSLSAAAPGLLNLLVNSEELGQQQSELARIARYKTKARRLFAALMTTVGGQGDSCPFRHLLLCPSTRTSQREKRRANLFRVVIGLHDANATALRSLSRGFELDGRGEAAR